MTNPTIKKIALTNFIRSSSNAGKTLDPSVITINEDLVSIYNFLSYYAIALQNTPAIDEINPFENGLDAANLVVDKLISSGRYWNILEDRPKTIKEILDEVLLSIDTGLAENSVATELATLKSKIGQNRFDKTILSATGSLDLDVQFLKAAINQLAADVFNYNTSLFSPLDNSKYSIIGKGNQTQGATISDKLNSLIDLHGNLSDLSHESLKQDILLISGLSINKKVQPSVEVIGAPGFSSLEEASDMSPVFYSPFDKPLEVKKLTVAIGSNDIQLLSTISLEVDDILTDFSVGVSGNLEDKVISAYPTNTININPNSKIRYIINTGSQGTDGLTIHNISLLLKDK